VLISTKQSNGSYGVDSTSTPDIDAVFCGNDGMASGAYQALVSVGKADKVKVYGFDGAEMLITSIGENKIAATGMQFPK
jgi:ribose transport system substrate-binding protein